MSKHKSSCPKTIDGAIEEMQKLHRESSILLFGESKQWVEGYRKGLCIGIKALKDLKENGVKPYHNLKGE